MKLLSDQTVEIWGGLECTINRVGNAYHDQLAQSGHRERDTDIALFAGLGLKKMRYPILWEQHEPSAGRRIEWAETAIKLAALQRHGIDVIAGLVHHGSGPAHVSISDDRFATGLAAYAGQVARRFPWIDYYTPVNEPLTTARFCGLYGFWHPHESSNAAFCRILVNECKATVLAMSAIRTVNPVAKLVQTDDLAKVYSSPALNYQAGFENERRWLSYDLLCGRVDRHHALWGYLITNGINEIELKYFCEHPCPPDILGVNYYLTSERFLDDDLEAYPAHTHGGNGRHFYADVEAVRVGKIKPDGLQQLLVAAWERYHLPLAVTEVHLHCTREEQMRWLNESWLTANSLKADGIPVLAITPWALLGLYGWDKLLTEPGGSYEPGVFDCRDGKPRPTILAAMIKAYSRNSTFNHPALDHPGWWHRDCRAAYGQHRIERISTNGLSIAIDGKFSAELVEICSRRCLNIIDTVEAVLHEIPIWATIVASDPVEIRCGKQATLYIALDGNLDRNLNAALDLLIDGESGYWLADHSGMLVKSAGDHLKTLHALAS